MRRYSIATRLLLSSAAVLLLGLVSVLPNGMQPVSQARPLFQDPPPASPTINPSLPLDLRVDDNTKTGNPGAIVEYRFSVTNRAENGCPATSNIGISVGNSTFTPTFPRNISVPPGETGSFSIQFVVPANGQRGITDNAQVTATCSSPTSIADQEIVITTVGGPTPTTTSTPPATSTPTATATSTGPTVTPTPVCVDPAEPDNDPNSARELQPWQQYAK